MDLIIGIHSIAQVLNNPKRAVTSLVATEEGLKELYKRGKIDPKQLEAINVVKLGAHQFQEEAKKEYKKRELTYQRVPSQVFVLASALELSTVSDILSEIESGKTLKILALDQVTDTHNGAAIMRTAAFYDVDYLITGAKGSFGLTPSFYRIASGATEHVKLLPVASLPKFLNKIQQKGVTCVGLSEHADDNEIEATNTSLCLVLGAEDVGMSNAVSRVVSKTIALKPAGKIQSLNVSVAAAISMERIF